jgi:hypothetical protein
VAAKLNKPLVGNSIINCHTTLLLLSVAWQQNLQTIGRKFHHQLPYQPSFAICCMTAKLTNYWQEVSSSTAIPTFFCYLSHGSKTYKPLVGNFIINCHTNLLLLSVALQQNLQTISGKFYHQLPYQPSFAVTWQQNLQTIGGKFHHQLPYQPSFSFFIHVLGLVCILMACISGCAELYYKEGL